jgi:hypothetical protein
VVRFFGKQPRKTSKEATTKEASAQGNAAKPAPVKAAASPEADTAVKKPASRTRRAPARPPRRDWAAEAAATPVTAPAPAPASLATSPAEEGEHAAVPSPAKRRRGTRGGRGRKKPGVSVAAAAPVAAPEEAPRPLQLVRELPKKAGPPPSLEAVVQHQAAVLEGFARDVSATLKELQTAVAGLREQVARREVAGVQQRVGIFVDVPNVIYAA